MNGKKLDISLSLLRKTAALLEKQRAKPLTVQDNKEARVLTKNDQTGHVWSVGEKFYLLDDLTGRCGLRIDEPLLSDRKAQNK